MSRNLTEAALLETGEKVIAGSVRPDGTIRKERRIRAGYTPQEEQQVYQSRGTLVKQNVPTCPGMDEGEVAALKQLAAKGKKQSSGANQASKPKPVANTSTGPKEVGTPALPAVSKGPGAADSVPTSAATVQAHEDPKASIEKQIRNLKKKIRQCSDLEEKKRVGAALDPDQEEKLMKSAVWEVEVQQLEAQLTSLGL